MKKILFSLVFVLGILSPNFLLAQDNPVIKVEMDNGTPDPAINNVHSNHILKINPFAFGRGDIPIYYENNFSGRLSLEVGVGLTIKDFLRETYSDSSMIKFNYNTNEEAKLGYSYRIGLRYYAASYGNEPEGIYFGLNFRNQTYNSTLSSFRDITAQDEKLQVNNRDIFLSLGYVYLIDENTYIDPFIGFGVRTRSYDEVLSDGNGGYTIDNNSDMVPLFILGFKLAIGIK
jgi:hypothetical protein